MPIDDYVQPVRTGVSRAVGLAERAGAAPEAQVDYLDIPAFLRKQAD